MMGFAGYAIEHDGQLLAQLYKTRALAVAACEQNNIPVSNIVQLFRYKSLS